ncbi:MAG: GYD domain-containing protein [Pirellula sp.]
MFSNERKSFTSFIKFSQQRIKDIDHTTKRAAIFKAEAKKFGLLILEAPDDETATAVILHLASMGIVHTSTCRAFTAAEMDNILSKAHGG